MLKKHIILILMLLSVRALFAQDGDKVPLNFGVTPPQSGMSSSSGTMVVQVPMENLGMIPVALSYAATGIKVEQRAGLVGLGWDLSTDAYISREVRGLPDDSNNGYSGTYPTGNNILNSLDYTESKNIVYGVWDSEPDVFRFRCFGLSGTFLMGPYGKIVNLSHDNIKIKPYFSSTLGYYKFELTGPSGNVYTFDLIESMSQKEGSNAALVYNSKWYLSNVDIYNDANDITLNYFQGSTISVGSTFEYAVKKLANGEIKKEPKVITSSWRPRILSSVVYGGYRIEFSYGFQAGMTDATRQLNQITFKEAGITYSVYKLNYDYFLNETSSRLMLRNVQKINGNSAITLAGFQYYGEGAKEIKLPSYNSKKKDHWGFFNNNTANTLFTFEGANREPSFLYARANSLRRMYVNDKGYEQYSYSLQQYDDNSVIRPAGGLRIRAIKTFDGTELTVSKSFIYDVGTVSTGQIYALPQYDRHYVREYTGIREDVTIYNTTSYRPLDDIMGRSVIYSTIKVYDADGNKEETHYHNFSDDLIESNYYPRRYKFRLDWKAETLSGNTTPLEQTNDTPYGSYSFFGTKAGLVKVNRVYDSNEKLVSAVNYTYQKFNSNTRLTGWKFLHYLDHAYYANFHDYFVGKYTIQPYYYRLSKTEATTYNPNNIANSRKRISTVVYHSKLLLPTRTETYLDGETTNHMITENTYFYDYVTACGTSRDNCEGQCDNEYANDYYDCVNGGGDKLECDLLAERNRSSCYSICESEFNACLAEGGAPKNLLEHNLLTLIRSSSQFKDNKLLAKKENTYSNNGGGFVQLARAKSYIYNNVLTSDISYTYNANGKLTRVVDNRTNDSKVYILDGLERVIAETENINNNQVYYEGFETSGIKSDKAKTGLRHFSGDFAVNFPKPSGNYTITYWYRESGIWKFKSKPYTGATTLTEGTEIDEVRIFPDGSGLKTYAYHPGGKLKSETDYNNIVLSTEYDALGRISAVRDGNNDIIKSYAYNLRNPAIPAAEPSCSYIYNQCTSGCEEEYKAAIANCGSRDPECMDAALKEKETCLTNCSSANNDCLN